MGALSGGGADLALQVASGTLTGLDDAGSAIMLRGNFNISVWGTFVATVELERSFDGGTTWIRVTFSDGGILAYTAPASAVWSEAEYGVLFRLRCTAYTSGSINWRLSLGSDASTSTPINISDGAPNVMPNAPLNILASTYNAATNTPTIADNGTGAGAGANNAYVVAVAGTVTVDSIGAVSIGDIIFNSGGTKWLRAPYSAVYKTMSLQDADDVAITNGSATLSALAATKKLDLAGVVNDIGGTGAYRFAWADTYGFRIASLSDAGDFATLGDVVMGGTLSSSETAPLPIPLNGGFADATTEPNTTYNHAFTDKYGFLSAGELAGGDWVFQNSVTIGQTLTVGSFSTRETIIDNLATLAAVSGQSKAVGIADVFGQTQIVVDSTGAEATPPDTREAPVRFSNLITLKPVGAGVSTAGTSGATYAAVYTLETDADLFRFMIPSNLSAANLGAVTTVKVCCAVSAAVNDGITPVDGLGNPVDWTAVTFNNGGMDVDYTTQLADIASSGAVTSFTLLTRSSSSDSRDEVITLTDWVQLSTLAATDNAEGFRYVFVRCYVTGSPRPYNIAGQDLRPGNFAGRVLRDYKQTGDFVSSNWSSFTSTTLAGELLVCGIQYCARAKGVTVMIVSDSTFVWGSAANNYFMQRAMMQLSSASMPVSVAAFGHGGGTSAQFLAEASAIVEAVDPQIILLRPWSQNDAPTADPSAQTDRQWAKLFDFATRMQKVGRAVIMISPWPTPVTMTDESGSYPDSNRVRIVDRVNQCGAQGWLTIDGDALFAVSGTSDPAEVDLVAVPGGVHLGELGHQMVLTKLIPILRRLLRLPGGQT